MISESVKGMKCSVFVLLMVSCLSKQYLCLTITVTMKIIVGTFLTQ